MKRILVNAMQQEELRVAIVDGQKLCDLDIEAAYQRQKKGNIYKGVVSSIAPSLNAVFVDYGGLRHGFLSLKEISKRYFPDGIKGSLRNRSIQDLIKEGQELIVQIAREERGNKGASLTTFISLVGRYVVLLPNNPRAHGVSQRIEGKERNDMLDVIQQLDKHEDEGLIVRTAGTGSKKATLQKNINYLRQLWQAIEKAATERPAPFLIYQEANVVIQVLRDNMGEDISEVIIDSQEVYEQAKAFVGMMLPRNARKLKLYDGTIPLFNRMQIEGQIETLYQREVFLPSGGSIVIDHTEALTTIDINSARATQKKDLEQTALATNLEATDEIARQLRLRDLGGLFAIDFIDMLSFSNRTKVERRLSEVLKSDRARIQLGKISKFGLLEMSRQRLRPSLGDASEIVCPRCNGHGFIRTVESCALVILRLIEEEAMKDKTKRVVGQVPVAVNSFLLNEKRTSLAEIEKRYEVEVSIVADVQMETPHYKIMRHRENGDAQEHKSSDELTSIRSSRDRQIAMAKKESDVSVVAAVPSLFIPEKLTIKESLTRLVRKLISTETEKKKPIGRFNKKRLPRQKYNQRRSHSDRLPAAKDHRKRRTDKRRNHQRSSFAKKMARGEQASRRASSYTKNKLNKQYPSYNTSDTIDYDTNQTAQPDFSGERQRDVWEQDTSVSYSPDRITPLETVEEDALCQADSLPVVGEDDARFHAKQNIAEHSEVDKAKYNELFGSKDTVKTESEELESDSLGGQGKRPKGVVAKAPSADSTLSVEVSGMTQVETRTDTLSK